MEQFSPVQYAVIKHALEVLREDVTDGPAYMAEQAQDYVRQSSMRNPPVLSVIDELLQKFK